MRFPGRELAGLLPTALPSDDARQTLADRYIEREVGRSDDAPWRVLDLGCGPGTSVDFFRARDPSVQWVGLDLPDSPEVRMRTRTDALPEDSSPAPPLTSSPSTLSACGTTRLWASRSSQRMRA